MRTNNQNGKRSRGRGRRPSGFNQPNVNRNTTFESNGPEGKLRGNAQQLYEKYTALAQDANSSSERISAEAFSQFADHYYRLHQTILAAMEQKRNSQENKTDSRQNSVDDSSTEIDNSAEQGNNLAEKDKEDQTLKPVKALNNESHISDDKDEINSIAIEKAPNLEKNKDVQQKTDDAVA